MRYICISYFCIALILEGITSLGALMMEILTDGANFKQLNPLRVIILDVMAGLALQHYRWVVYMTYGIGLSHVKKMMQKQFRIKI